MTKDHDQKKDENTTKHKEGRSKKSHNRKTSEISFYKDERFIAELIANDGNTSLLTFCQDTGEVSVAKQFSIDNKVYLPLKSKLIKRRNVDFTSTINEKGIVILPGGVEEYGTEADLIREIRGFINRYVELGKEFESIYSHYILFTWVYDRFPELPYIRYIGDWGTGKSRGLIVVGSLCYRPMFTFGATTVSPIFRLLEIFRGTLIIDEADHQGSDTWKDIVKILNVGFQRNFPLLRTEEIGRKREPKEFYVYGPKMLSTRYAFKDQALESRCITKVMTPNSRRADIPINLPDDFFIEVDKLQRKLLLFRLRNHSKVALNPSVYDPNLEDRYNQVLIPLLSVVNDDEVINQIKSQILELQERAVEGRADSLEGKILRALVLELQEYMDTQPLIKAITKRAKAILGEGVKLSSKKTGSVLRSMGFQTKQDPSSKNYYVLVDDNRLEGLKKRYGITDHEESD